MVASTTENVHINHNFDNIKYNFNTNRTSGKEPTFPTGNESPRGNSQGEPRIVPGASSSQRSTSPSPVSTSRSSRAATTFTDSLRSPSAYNEPLRALQRQRNQPSETTTLTLQQLR